MYPDWANGKSTKNFINDINMLVINIFLILDIGMAIAMIAILAVPFMAVVQFLIGLLQEYKRPDFDLLTVSFELGKTLNH